MLGIASTELAWAYVLCILASIGCVIYGVVKWNDSGPLTEDLQDLEDWDRMEKGD